METSILVASATSPLDGRWFDALISEDTIREQLGVGQDDELMVVDVACDLKNIPANRTTAEYNRFAQNIDAYADVFELATTRSYANDVALGTTVYPMDELDVWLEDLNANEIDELFVNSLDFSEDDDYFIFDEQSGTKLISYSAAEIDQMVQANAVEIFNVLCQ